MWEALTSAQGARAQALVFAITTAGAEALEAAGLRE
jgi:phage terminase large subunit-like protein